MRAGGSPHLQGNLRQVYHSFRDSRWAADWWRNRQSLLLSGITAAQSQNIGGVRAPRHPQQVQVHEPPKLGGPGRRAAEIPANQSLPAPCQGVAEQAKRRRSGLRVAPIQPIQQVRVLLQPKQPPSSGHHCLWFRTMALLLDQVLEPAAELRQSSPSQWLTYPYNQISSS